MRNTLIIAVLLLTGCHARQKALYRVHWRSTVTGVTGHGSYCMPKQTAEAWRDSEAWPLKQWVERCIEPASGFETERRFTTTTTTELSR